MRRKLALDQQKMGDIVYSTKDDAVAEGKRELAAFDKELGVTPEEIAAAEQHLGGYLPPVNEIAYEDDFELVAFDEEMARREREKQKVRVF